MADADSVVLVILDGPSLFKVFFHTLALLLEGASQFHALRDLLSEVGSSQPDSFRKLSLVTKEDLDVLVVPPKVKQTISGFVGASSSNPRMFTSEDKTFGASIDVYVSDFGNLQIIPNRTMAGLETCFLLQTDMAAAAYLRDFQVNDLAKTGDSEKKQLLVEFTLEVRNEAAHGILLDITE